MLPERRARELHHKGVWVKWSLEGKATCSTGTISHTATSLVDEVLRELGHYFRCSDTWIHRMLLDTPVDRSQYRWLQLSPDESCGTIEHWLEYVRDLMLLPAGLAVVQRRILPGKPGLFALLGLPLDKRERMPVYKTLKQFLRSTEENVEHQQLYKAFIASITSSSSLDLDLLEVDTRSPVVQMLRTYYNTRKV
jgi:hypothetical protein